MAQQRPTRKQRFAAALKLAGLTLEQWCEQAGVSRHHIREGFKGNRVLSDRLNGEIDQFIAKHLTANAA